MMLIYKNLCLLILIGVCALPLGAAETSRTRGKPLNWEWKIEEIKELKGLLKKVTKNDDGSFSLETDNWRVHTWHTPLFTAQAGKYMELFTAVFNKAFMLKGDRGFKDFKPELSVYANRKMYLEKSNGDEWSLGLCVSQWDSTGAVQITLHTYYEHNSKKDGKEPVFGTKVPLNTIQHEGTHCLLQCVYGPMKIPYWLNEGAATYYEAWPLRAKISDDGESKEDIKARATRRTFSSRPWEMREYFNQNKKSDLPHLDKLVTANSREEFYCDNGGKLTLLNYDMASSFIDFLMSSRKRRPFMLSLLERIRERRGECSPANPWINDAELQEYEEQWLRFVIGNWGVKFDMNKIKERARELRARGKAINTKEK